MNHANKKFAHFHVAWQIQGCCLWFLPLRKKFESPFFLVNYGEVETKWRMIVQSSPDEDAITFQLKRFYYRGNHSVRVHARLFYLSLPEHYLILERQILFPPGKKVEGGCRTRNLRHEFMNVTLELIVYDPGQETVHECEDAYLRQLSEDLGKVYETQSSCHFDRVTIETSSGGVIYVDGAIFFHRIKDMVDWRNILKVLKEHVYDDVDKVVRFLFTADMAPAIRNPEIGTYYLAEKLKIQPLIAYYKPDILCMFSSTRLHNFKISWTIARLASRKESCLVCPTVNGEIYSSALKIFPDVNEINGGHVGVQIEIHLDVEKHVCVELSLAANKNKEMLIKDCHRTFSGHAVFGSDNLITPENLKIIPADGSATIKLKVCLTDSPADSSVRVSIKYCRPYCIQRNYIQLSKDMLCLYESTGFKESDLPYVVKLSRVLHRYGYFLKIRNSGFVTNFLESFQSSSEISKAVNFETLDQVIQFLFSGIFSKKLRYEDVFYLYEVAKQCHFDTLKDALVDQLRNYFVF